MSLFPASLTVEWHLLSWIIESGSLIRLWRKRYLRGWHLRGITGNQLRLIMLLSPHGWSDLTIPWLRLLRCKGCLLLGCLKKDIRFVIFETEEYKIKGRNVKQIK